MSMLRGKKTAERDKNLNNQVDSMNISLTVSQPLSKPLFSLPDRFMNNVDIRARREVVYSYDSSNMGFYSPETTWL